MAKSPAGIVPPSPEEKAMNLIRYGLQRNGVETRKEYIIMTALATGQVGHEKYRSDRVDSDLLHLVRNALATAIRDGIGIA